MSDKDVVKLQQENAALRQRIAILEAAQAHRKQALEHLQQEIEHLQAIFDYSLDAILVTNDEARYVEANPAACHLLGYTREELLQLSLYDLTPGLNREQGAALRQTFLQQDKLEGEYIMLHKDGTPLTLEYRSRPNFRPGLHLSMLRDVSRRKEVEQTLRESEQNLRGIIDYSLDGIVLADEEGRVIEWNEAQHRLTGQARAEVLGCFLWDVLYRAAVPERRTPQYYEQLKQVLQSFFTGTINLHFLSRPRNVEIQHRSGERRYVQEMAFAVQTRKGTRLCGMSRDVTRQKRVEEALHHRLKLEELVSNISTRFINVALNRLEEEINHALQLIGQFAGVERVYISLINKELVITEVYEWYATSNFSKEEAFLGMSIEPMQWAMEKLRNFDYIYVPSVDELPPEAAFEKALWQANNLQAVLTLSLVIDNTLVGVLGFSMEHQKKAWLEEDLNLLGLVAEIFSNVLARRQIEREKEKHRQALRESEERYRTLFERTRNPILVIDTAGNYIMANRAALQFLECTEKELKGRNVDYYLPPGESGARMMEVHRSLWPKGGTMEARYYIKDHLKILEATITPGTWQGRPVMFEVGKDITGQKQAEEARRRSEARLRAVSELVSDFAYALHIRPDGSILIEWTTMEAEGYSSHIVDRAIDAYTDILHPEDEPILVNRIEKLLSGQEDVSEYRIVDPKSGQVHWIRDYSRPIWDTAEQRVVHIIGAMQNITERRQAEEALRESNQRLEETLAELQATQKQVVKQERLAAVGQLAAGIAHDFNNLLTSIIGFAELLQMNPQLPEDAQADLERIIKQGQRGAHMVRQILDFGRKAIRQPQHLDLIPFAKEAVRFLKRTIPENIHITLIVEAERLPVRADPAQLQQLLTNLVLNARDAMPQGGQVNVCLSKIELSPQEPPPYPGLQPGPWAVCRVADTGEGIPEEVLPHIFEPFFTTKQAGQGSGLGLDQVYGIVKQQNSYIDVQSTPGIGTEFTIFLPLQSAAPIPGIERVLDVQRGRGETILLVEDEHEVLAVTGAILERLGYRVVTATNGQEALTLYQEQGESIDLVLSDMVMPGVDGLALFHVLKEQNSALKMVLMSGYPLGGEEESRFLNRADVRWLSKPLTVNRVAQVISQALHDAE